MDFLRALEASSFSTWVREAMTIWAYPTVLFLHTIGLAFVVGMSLAIAVRVLGFGAGLPLKPLEKFYRVMWAGFWVNAVSGVVLVAVNPNKILSPVFVIKMLCITFAVITVQKTRNRVYADVNVDSAPATKSAKNFALLSILFWMGAITAGRLMAYFDVVG